MDPPAKQIGRARGRSARPSLSAMSLSNSRPGSVSNIPNASMTSLVSPRALTAGTSSIGPRGDRSRTQQPRVITRPITLTDKKGSCIVRTLYT
jgi:hypothetical protein